MLRCLYTGLSAAQRHALRGPLPEMHGKGQPSRRSQWRRVQDIHRTAGLMHLSRHDDEGP